jgi:hypothetical protein
MQSTTGLVSLFSLIRISLRKTVLNGAHGSFCYYSQTISTTRAEINRVCLAHPVSLVSSVSLVYLQRMSPWFI